MDGLIDGMLLEKALRMRFTTSFFYICIVVVFWRPQALASQIDVRNDIIAPLTQVTEGVHREVIKFETKEVAAVPTPSHTELQIVFENGGMIFRLIFDRVAIANPKLLLPDVTMFDFLQNYGSSDIKYLHLSINGLLKAYGPKTSVYDISELLTNARDGNIRAHARWLRWRLAVLRNLTVSKEFENQFPGSESHIRNVLNEGSKRLQKLTEQALEDEKKALALHETAVANNSMKLKELVLNNDRAGVGKYLRKTLPWKMMLPSEERAWNIWIEAIEHPDPSRTVLGFRGFSHKEKGLLRQNRNGKTRAFFAPLLNRDIDRVDENMKDLVHTRTVLGDRDKAFAGENVETVVRVSDLMHTHSEGGKPSIFLSLSAKFEVAEGFVTGTERFPGPNGALLAVRIDARRAVPNAATSVSREIELLTPLIIFPDEALLFQENYDHSEQARERFIRTLEERGENVRSNPERYFAGKYFSEGFEFLARTQGKIQNRSCHSVFL